MNQQRQAAKHLMKSGNPADRRLGRQLSRGRVTPGSTLDMAIRISAKVAKDGGGSGGAGPATGTPMTGGQVYTPTPESGRKRRVSNLSKKILDWIQ